MSSSSGSSTGQGTPPVFPYHSKGLARSAHGRQPSSSSPSSAAAVASSPARTDRGPTVAAIPLPAAPSTPTAAGSNAAAFPHDPWDCLLPSQQRARWGSAGAGGWGGSPLSLRRAGSSPSLSGGEGGGSGMENRLALAGGGGLGGSGGSSGALVALGQTLQRSSSAILNHSARDAVGGVSGGLKSAALGVGLGLTSLVAAPTLGASTHGVKGFFAGLGAGLAGAVVLPVVGVAAGMAYVVGGIANTPASVVQMMRGRQWCPLQQKWIRYDLEEEARRVLSKAPTAQGDEEDGDDDDEGIGRGIGHDMPPTRDGPSAASSSSPPPPRRAGGGSSSTGDCLYSILGVDPSAGPEAIKRAYYREALAVHPDRTQEAWATERFQRLSEAYQVLATPELRAAYDKRGNEAFKDTAFIAPDLFFGMVFGAERFRPYLGKLFVASAVGALSRFAGESGGPAGPAAGAAAAAVREEEEEGEEAGDMSSLSGAHRQMTAGQVRREVRIALHLLKVLSPLVAGQQDSFARFCLAEARDLSGRPLGALILRELGTVYAQVAGAYLGGLSGLGASLGRRRVRLQRQAEVAGATLEAIKLGKKFCDAYGGSGNGSGTGSDRSGKEHARPPTHHQHKGKGGSSNDGGMFARRQHRSAPDLNSQTSPGSAAGPGHHHHDHGHHGPGTPATTLSLSSSRGSTPEVLTPDPQHYWAAAAATTSSRSLEEDDDGECKEGPQQQSQQQQQQQQQQPGSKPTAMAAAATEELDEEGLPRLVSVLWRLAAYDISETVGRACGKLLSDAGADKEVRRLRAQGLLELGRAFKAEADACLEAAGGKVDYRAAYAALDREMLASYESSASIYSMANASAAASGVGAAGMSASASVGSSSRSSSFSHGPYGVPHGDDGNEEEDEEEEGIVL